MQNDLAQCSVHQSVHHMTEISINGIIQNDKSLVLKISLPEAFYRELNCIF